LDLSLSISANFKESLEKLAEARKNNVDNKRGPVYRVNYFRVSKSLNSIIQ
jgi:hypothetical protein